MELMVQEGGSGGSVETDDQNKQVNLEYRHICYGGKESREGVRSVRTEI
jgi:hypothetical protein